MAYADPNDPRALASRRAHYHENKEPYKNRAMLVKAKIRTLIYEAKDKPCMDCGISYPFFVMDFDHRPGEIKLFNPSQLPNCGSIKNAITELTKCDVVCANCHRIRTWTRENVSLA